MKHTDWTAQIIQHELDHVDEIGFLPLFKNEIPGFSLEERTVAEHWWSENPDIDPWEWRAIIAGSGEVAYGKFFDGKAGFISKEWLPYFVNCRRDGYDFDALWDDGKASKARPFVKLQIYLSKVPNSSCTFINACLLRFHSCLK